MKTLNLQQAAVFLHMHPYTIMHKVHAGEIPAAKPGKRWVFIEDDLIEYLRSLCRPASSFPAMLDLHNINAESIPPANFKNDYLKALGLADCPQIHSPKPGARSGARHADAARRVAGEAVELVGNSAKVAQSNLRMTQGT